MNAATTLPNNAPLVSFEFFPPKTEKSEATLWSTVKRLAPLQPRFVSVTYGADGSTRDRTHRIVSRINQETNLTGAPHLTCVEATAGEVNDVAKGYWDEGVRHIVALRGDPPQGQDNYAPHPGGYQYAADLVSGLRNVGDFEISVAAYPEVHPDAQSAQQDLEFFQRKVDAGANSAITQYFYCPEAYALFLERCARANINIPIYPGIMPITNAESLFRFSEKAGADIPRWLQYGMADQDNAQDLADFGVEVVSNLCNRLIELGAPGLHFYTLNRWGATTRICENLNR